MIAEIKLNRVNETSAREIVKVFSENLKKWKDEEPFCLEGDMLFYCPLCSYTAAESHKMVERYGRPHCWTCHVEMVKFDVQRFKELRQRLADEALSIAPRVVEALLEAAETHGSDLLFVEIYDQMLYIYPDFMNEFRYDAGARRLEAYFHRYDAPEHVETLKALIRNALKLGLGILVQINPAYMKMSIPCNLPAMRPEDSIFSGIEIRMSAEELRDFARGYGGLY